MTGNYKRAQALRRLRKAERDRGKKNRACWEISHALVELQTKAHDAGLTITGHAINNALNAVGWEAAGKVLAAAGAARGKRPGEK
jgi:hypothetical protein